ncbi:Hsp20/alpha crystallin family protein [Streptomyces sp. NPDC050448]|uniref:Hsp20/alpha crystallin family protein n=1 Tax=Streptomyces sp. NPDC050448 TaxID=3155404 RepID=UPI00341F81F8
MALIMRRRGGLPALAAAGMDPFRQFESMWDEMGQLLERAAVPAATGGAWLPMAEEEETDDSYIVKAELPGYPPENINIEVEGDELVISGELSEEHQGKVLTRRSGKFMYRTSLPAGADSEHCDADLDHGVLTVTVPKMQQQQRRKIEIGKRHAVEGRTAEAGGGPQSAISFGAEGQSAEGQTSEGESRSEPGI